MMSDKRLAEIKSMVTPPTDVDIRDHGAVERMKSALRDAVAEIEELRERLRVAEESIDHGA